MTRNHDGDRFFQLIPSAGGGPAAVWAPGGQARFRFSGVPFLSGGNLCNHALGILVTVVCQINAGGINQAGLTTGKLGTTAYCLDDFLAALFVSAKVEGCLHKEPINEQTWKAAVWRTIEYVSCGYRYYGRQPPQVMHQGSRKNNIIAFDLFFPLSYGLGEKGWQHNALPTFCYADAGFVLNFASGFADAQACEGTVTCSAAKMRATLVMLPQSEINLAPGHEWVDYQTNASPSTSQVILLEKFGLTTALDNVERGGGVDFLAIASSRVKSTGYAGAALHAGIRKIGIPFRSQESTSHIEPFLRNMCLALDRPNYLATQDLIEPSDIPVDTVGGDKAGWPYPENYQEVATNLDSTHYADDGCCIDNPDWFPIIIPGRDLELSKIASYEADQQIQVDYATGAAPLQGTIHHVLAHQFKSWTPEGWTALQRKAVDSGVAQAVLGTSSVTHSLKLVKKNPDPTKMDMTKLRYFPHKVVPLTATGSG